MNKFTAEEIREFEIEAEDLLAAAETALLQLEEGSPLSASYDAIFRAFHSIKGAAGMMDMTALQAHMHQLENVLTGLQASESLPAEIIDLFLRGTDAARVLLAGGSVQFTYQPESPERASPAPVVSPRPEAVVAPLPHPPSPSVRISVPANRADGIPQTSGRVVVIDDEPDIVEYIQDMLEDAGFEVFGYTEPREALRALPSLKADMVVTDIAMPEISGMEVLHAVRGLDAELPVVFASGQVTKALLVQAIEYGIDAVLEKPFSEHHLVQVCHDACRRSRLLRLLNRSVNLLLYQFSDLDERLRERGQEQLRNILKQEIAGVLEHRRELRMVTQKSRRPTRAAA